MLYVERNKVITAEIRSGVKIERGEIVGRRSLSGTVTQIAGSYYSQTLDRKLFLALKIPPSLYDFGDKWITDMRNHAAIFDNIPPLQAELPAFLSLVRDKDGKDVGHLTEDFSKGGKHKVYEMGIWDKTAIGDVQGPIAELFRDGENQLSDEEILNMFFWVRTESGEHRRMGDLDKAMMHVGAKKRRARFPIAHLAEDQDSHTISLDEEP